MEKIIGLVFAVAIGVGVTAIASAQQKTFSLGCSAMSFPMPSATGLNKGMQILQIPCPKAAIQ